MNVLARIIAALEAAYDGDVDLTIGYLEDLERELSSEQTSEVAA